jgi:hypothetical protein
VLACCGGMVLVSGLERMTFEDAEARASLERFSRERFASAWWNLIRERT